MNSYITKIVFQIICGEGDHASQFDEQWRLISARDDKDAFDQARRIGIEEEEPFLNHSNKPVTWKFMGVVELQAIELKNGTELFSSIQEIENAQAYVQVLKQKADNIEARFNEIVVNS